MAQGFTESLLQATSAEPDTFNQIEPTIESFEGTIENLPPSTNFNRLSIIGTLPTQTAAYEGSNLLTDFVVEKDLHTKGLRRVPESIPFLMKLVDRNMQTAAIRIFPDYLVTGLKFTPNPSTFSINSSKVINRYNTMTRWVEEHWGDEIDNIMFSGSTLSFLGYSGGDRGVTNEKRNFTDSYRMMRELAAFVKLNGLIYQDDLSYEGTKDPNSVTNLFLEKNPSFMISHPLKGLVKERYYINLFFDYVSFLGRFESFDIIEDSTMPYRFTYNCVFKAEKTKYHQGPSATVSEIKLPESNLSLNTNSISNTNFASPNPNLGSEPSFGIA